MKKKTKSFMLCGPKRNDIISIFGGGTLCRIIYIQSSGLLPVFGAGTVMIPWALIKLFDKDYKIAVGILVIWGIGKVVRNIIQPKMSSLSNFCR